MDITTNCHGHREVICRQLVCSHLHVVGFSVHPELTHDFHNSVGVQFWKNIYPYNYHQQLPIGEIPEKSQWWYSSCQEQSSTITHSIIHCHFSTYFSDWDQPQKKPDRVGVIVRRWSWDLIFFPWGTKWYEKKTYMIWSDIHGYTGKKTQLACSELTPLYWWLVAHEHLWTMKYPVNPSWIKGLYPLVI